MALAEFDLGERSDCIMNQIDRNIGWGPRAAQTYDTSVNLQAYAIRTTFIIDVDLN